MSKVYYYCNNCGHEAAKWLGKCPACKQWNTLVEEVKPSNKKNKLFNLAVASSSATLIQNIKHESSMMTTTTDAELDIVLGGGIVSGSVILLAGEPGIGKSTLLLQIALSYKSETLYVSGEEALTQIKMRADRIGIKNQHCHVFSETSTTKIINHCENRFKKENPYQLIIIDSIQTLFSDYIDTTVGSISQIKQCCSELVQYAKKTNTPIILIGHITKEGQIAGPKVLEHMVDVVLNFEGEKTHLYRILRASKNRYGATSKVGVYEMVESGLKQVLNPSTILMNDGEQQMSGTSIASTFEGQKTFLVEVQALVTPAVYGTPQRSVNGFNLKRLNILLAVLEKKCGFKLSSQDVFLNIAGGISVSDPSMDLAIVASILSSNEDFIIGTNICFAGEVGLNGEVRPIPRIESHIQEAQRIGFKTIVISSKNKLVSIYKKIEIINCDKVMDLYTYLANLIPSKPMG